MKARRQELSTEARRASSFLGLASAVWLVAAGCTMPQPPAGSAGPVEAVQDFADAVRKGDAATAWSLLSSKTQRQADRIAADAGRETGRQMLFTSALPGAALEAKQLSVSGGSAEVQTSADGGVSKTWHLVREQGRWRIDLDLAH